MNCIQLAIPPLPMFVTVGHDTWRPGRRHPERTFEVYDLLLVTKGTLYMTENGRDYEISANTVLLLEPGLKHEGYRPCEEDTEIYWVHFVHASPAVSVAHHQVAWNEWLDGDSSDNAIPIRHSMFVPKWMELDLTPLLPVLKDMLAIHDRVNTGNAVQLHALLVQLLVRLQENLIFSSKRLPSATLSGRLEEYLRSRPKTTFSMKELEGQFHFNADYLTRSFKKYVGMTPLQFVNHLCIEEAKRHLMFTDHTIQEIAQSVGIADTNYFTRLFRKRTGLSPAEFRRKRRGLI